MIFGPSTSGPTKFEPYKEYKLGDIVYNVNPDGTLKIWICNSNGSFEELKEPNWSEYNVTSMIERQINALSGKFGKQAGYTNEIYVEHQMWRILTPPTTELTDLGLTGMLGPYSYAEIYVDGKMIPNAYWSVTASGGIQFDSEYIASLSNNEHTVLVIGFEEKNVITKMIRRKQVVVPVTASEVTDNENFTSEEVVTIPYPFTPDQLSIDFDLYRDGVYIPSYMLNITEVEQTDPLSDPMYKLRINGLVNGDTSISHEYIFNFVYSVTNEVVLLKDDYHNTISNDDDSYMLTLYNVNFMNSYQQIKVYQDMEIVNSEKYVLSRSHVNMVSQNDYFPVGTDIICPVWTYFLPSYALGEVPHNSQTYPVHVEESSKLPIPYLEHDPVTSDYMLFNDGGILLSDTRWYVDGNDFHYFSHEIGLVPGDRVDVRLIDNDDSVVMRSFFFTPSVNDQKRYDTSEDFTKYALVMVFTVSGMYVTQDRYTIDEVGITFNDDWSLYLTEGRIEVIGFRYVGDYTKTMFQVGKAYGTIDEQTVVANPFSDFNYATDSMLIFNDGGLYVGQHFFSITESGDIELYGEPLHTEDYLEVILIRNLSINISAKGGD